MLTLQVSFFKTQGAPVVAVSFAAILGRDDANPRKRRLTIAFMPVFPLISILWEP
jgi:hypothetical protein